VQTKLSRRNPQTSTSERVSAGLDPARGHQTRVANHLQPLSQSGFDFGAGLSSNPMRLKSSIWVGPICAAAKPKEYSARCAGAAPKRPARSSFKVALLDGNAMLYAPAPQTVYDAAGQSSAFFAPTSPQACAALPWSSVSRSRHPDRTGFLTSRTPPTLPAQAAAMSGAKNALDWPAVVVDRLRCRRVQHGIAVEQRNLDEDRAGLFGAAPGAPRRIFLRFGSGANRPPPIYWTSIAWVDDRPAPKSKPDCERRLDGD